MPKYRRVNSFKIMNDYKRTSLNLKYISAMADIGNKRFFKINRQKIEENIVQSKMENKEKSILLAMINDSDYHQIYCYASKLYNKYKFIYYQYEQRMDTIFMSIEEKSIFYA